MPAWPSTLPAPNRGGYALNPSAGFIRTNMVNGKARQRRKVTTVPTSIPVNWLFTEAQLGIFEAWFRHEINLGASSFTISLWNGKGFNAVTARFKKEYSAPVANGKYFTVSAELEVLDMPTMTKAQLQAYL